MYEKNQCNVSKEGTKLENDTFQISVSYYLEQRNQNYHKQGIKIFKGRFMDHN